MTREPSDPFRPAWIFPLYLGLAAAFFVPALLPGRQIYGTDYLGSTYFWESFASSAFANGELPAWLPTVYGGVPFFANPMDVYYPVSVAWRLLGLPVHVHLPLLFLVQFAVAGAGTYLLLRELGTRSFAAALGGLLFMWNGFLVSLVYGGHDNRATVVSLLPLAFYALHGAVRTGAPRWFGLLGLVLGCVLLPFQVQSSYYVLLACGAFFLYLLWQLGLLRSTRAVSRRIAGGAAALFLAFCLAAVNFLPFMAYVAHSPRGADEGRGYDYSVTWSMPPEETVGVAVPERSGILGEYVGENPFKLHMEYAGALTLVLCFVGGYVLKGRRLAWFFPVLGVLGLTLSFGGYTPLYRLYYAALPGIALFRSPGSAFFLVNFALAVFAALTFDRLHRLTLERDRRTDLSSVTTGAGPGATGEAPIATSGESLVTSEEGIETGEASVPDADLVELIRAGSVLGALLVAGVLAWAVVGSVLGGASLSGAPTASGYVAGIWRFALFTALFTGILALWLRGTLSVALAGALLFVFATVDFWVLDRRFLETVDEPGVSFAPDEVTRYLSGRDGPFRVDVLDDLPQDNYLTLFDMELVAGEHGNQLETYNDFLGGSDSTYTDKRNLAMHAFRSLANAEYTVSTDSTLADRGPIVFRGLHRGRRAFVYRDETILPRAFLVQRTIVAEDEEALFRRLSAQDFDPGREALLYEETPLALGDEAAIGTARVVERGATRVRVDVTSPSASLLVLTDAFYPDWEATVDGAPAPLLRAYHTFRAVPVPAGSHAVTFAFRPRRLHAGFAITLVTWVCVALTMILLWRRRRRAV